MSIITAEQLNKIETYYLNSMENHIKLEKLIKYDINENNELSIYNEELDSWTPISYNQFLQNLNNNFIIYQDNVFLSQYGYSKNSYFVTFFTGENFISSNTTDPLTLEEEEAQK